MTYITSSTGVQRAKWRQQTILIAKALKNGQGPEPHHDDGLLRIGVAFDDGLICIKLNPDKLQTMTVTQLAEHIYDLVIEEATKPNGVTPLEEIVPELNGRKGTLQ